MDCIAYKAGYKYQLNQTYIVNICIKPSECITTDFIVLQANGELTIQRGYAWDGPSGPTIDTLDFMRGSLVHDALYQLMRHELIDANHYKDKADRLLQTLCKQDGMNALRAWWVYQGVRYFGKPATDKANKKPLLIAPRQS
ncbi:hypothetical protein [Shewanella sp. NIFS-20-20]|uniref:hypothetical protein n=1 Tax=Shewanella sp. NIFS-20-20 TaxID=2853806 RepID=UPI001C49291E|nr:hypothetical protein [Shewanella sp. NIFS-20-20]MBV7315119.1 hypothetical protein [Shewanella sp. NIFS-20-20]